MHGMEAAEKEEGHAGAVSKYGVSFVKNYRLEPQRAAGLQKKSNSMAGAPKK